MKKMKKGAIELSVTFIVMIVIGIIVLIFAIALTTNIFRGATDWQEKIDQQTKMKIKNMLMSGERIAIPYTRQTLEDGLAVFYLGVLNVMAEEHDFRITILQNEAFDNSGNGISFGSWNILPTTGVTTTIASNDDKEFVYAFEPDNPRYPGPGIYIFDVLVIHRLSGTTDPFQNYGDNSVQKLYVEVP